MTLLGYRGHHLLQAMDGAEALKVACAEPPDLIISVILMPTMDGYEFVRELHTDPALGHLPVIFSTAQYLDQEAAALAQQCSEQRYRDLVEGSIQGMTIYRHFTPLFVIQAFATMFGYRPEEILALETLTRLFAPPGARAAASLSRRPSAGGEGATVVRVSRALQGWLHDLVGDHGPPGRLGRSAGHASHRRRYHGARKHAEAEREQLQAQPFEA